MSGELLHAYDINGKLHILRQLHRPIEIPTVKRQVDIKVRIARNFSLERTEEIHASHRGIMLTDTPRQISRTRSCRHGALSRPLVLSIVETT